MTKVKEKVIRRQVSVFLDLEDWKMLRAEALSIGVPVVELIRGWIAPDLVKLRRKRRKKVEPD